MCVSCAHVSVGLSVSPVFYVLTVSVVLSMSPIFYVLTISCARCVSVYYACVHCVYCSYSVSPVFDVLTVSIVFSMLLCFICSLCLMLSESPVSLVLISPATPLCLVYHVLLYCVHCT